MASEVVASPSPLLQALLENADTRVLVERVCDALCDLLTASESAAATHCATFVAITTAKPDAAASDAKAAPDAAAAAAAAAAGGMDLSRAEEALGQLDSALDECLEKLSAADALAKTPAANNARQVLSARLVSAGGCPLPADFIAAGQPAETGADAAADGDAKASANEAPAAAATVAAAAAPMVMAAPPMPMPMMMMTPPPMPGGGVGAGAGALAGAGAGMAAGYTTIGTGAGNGSGRGFGGPNNTTAGAGGGSKLSPAASAFKAQQLAARKAAAKPVVIPSSGVLTVAEQTQSARQRFQPPPPVPAALVKPPPAGTLYVWGLAESVGRGPQKGAAKTSAGVAPHRVPLSPAETTNHTRFVQVSCGLHFTAAVTADGRVLTCGSNGKDRNRLGLGTPSADHYAVAQPVAFPAPAPGAPVPFIVRVACGTKHTLALTHTGQLWSWGDDSTCHALGRAVSAAAPASLPGRVRVQYNRLDVPVAGMACGNRFSVCVTRADDAPSGSVGRVFAWGLNAASQCGVANSTASFADPTPVPALAALNSASPAPVSFRAVGCGFSWAMAVTTTGSLYTWGSNGDGQCGLTGSDAKLAVVVVPTKVAAFGTVADPTTVVVSADGSRGEHHGSSMALCSDGRVWAWGDNYKYKLGTGDDTRQPAPVKLGGTAASQAAGVACGGIHSALWTRAPASAGGAGAAGAGAPAAASGGDGHAYVWGCGSDGRLGLPDITKRGQTAKYLFKEKAPRSLHAAAAAAPAAAGESASAALPFKASQRALSVACDYYHTAAIIAD